MRQILWPSPGRLAARLAIAAMLVLWPLHRLERVLVVPLIPLYREVIWALDDSFTIEEVAVSHEGPNETLRFRANLTRPTRVAGRTVYPFGWNAGPLGGFQISNTLGGVLQYCAFGLIVVLAWPAARWRELGVRLAAFAPLAGLLLLIDIPTSVLAELWQEVLNVVTPGAVYGGMVWSRFLMGGGGLALGLLSAAVAILLAAPSDSRPTSAYAQAALSPDAAGR